MTRIYLAALLPLLCSAPALAQEMNMSMPGMKMPGMHAAPAGASIGRTREISSKHSVTSKEKTAHQRAATPATRATVVGSRRSNASAHPAMAGMAGMDMSAHEKMPGMSGNSHSGMAMGAQTSGAPRPAMPPIAGMNIPSRAGAQEGGSNGAPMGAMNMSTHAGMANMKMDGQSGSMPGMEKPAAEPLIPDTPPPPAATDHAADRYYDPAAMAASRHMMRMEMGDMHFSKVMANLLEYQSGSKGDGYRWEGQAWFGGDIHRLVLKSEGDGSVSNGVESGEVQALYSRAVGPYTDVQIGVRQDFSPRGRTYLALGAQSLFPGWFDAEGSLFLSPEGELLARAEGYQDFRLTQRLVLQPRAELNFAAQNSLETRMGSGLSNAELGLRLRYEIRREFAPYIGVSYDRRFGKTAGYARASGREASSATFVVGLRAWF